MVYRSAPHMQMNEICMHIEEVKKYERGACRHNTVYRQVHIKEDALTQM